MTENIDSAYDRATPLSIRMAAVLFPLLIDNAKRSQLISYGELAKQARSTHSENREVQNMIPVSMGRKLDVIHAFCRKRRLPDLASIAVNQLTQSPGDSYVGRMHAGKLQEEVFAFDWESQTVEFDEHLVEETKRTKKLVKRSEEAARGAMYEYYSANRALLPSDIVNLRDEIIAFLIAGHDAEDAFEMALRG